MSDDSFVMEMCGNRAAWQIVVDGVDNIDLEKVGKNSRRWLRNWNNDSFSMDVFCAW